MIFCTFIIIHNLWPVNPIFYGKRANCAAGLYDGEEFYIQECCKPDSIRRGGHCVCSTHSKRRRLFSLWSWKVKRQKVAPANENGDFLVKADTSDIWLRKCGKKKTTLTCRRGFPVKASEWGHWYTFVMEQIKMEKGQEAEHIQRNMLCFVV